MTSIRALEDFYMYRESVRDEVLEDMADKVRDVKRKSVANLRSSAGTLTAARSGACDPAAYAGDEDGLEQEHGRKMPMSMVDARTSALMVVVSDFCTWSSSIMPWRVSARSAHLICYAIPYSAENWNTWWRGPQSLKNKSSHPDITSTPSKARSLRFCGDRRPREWLRHLGEKRSGPRKCFKQQFQKAQRTSESQAWDTVDFLSAQAKLNSRTSRPCAQACSWLVTS